MHDEDFMLIFAAYYMSNKYFSEVYLRLHLGDPAFIRSSAFNQVTMVTMVQSIKT